jgi:quercetin dioxygenase-like cupin family protein
MHAKQPYSDIKTLAQMIATLAPYEGSFELRLPGVHAVRVSHANEELTHYVQRASLGIIAQGAKVAMIGDATYGCEAGNLALYSIDVPVASRVTRASAAEPYLVLMLDLDPAKTAELSLKVFPHGIPQVGDVLPLQVAEADRYVIDAATRLLEGRTMVITRSGSKPAQQGPSATFTGNVRVTPLFDANDNFHASCASVSFEAGARSAWHTHPKGQLLIVTAGVGRIQQSGRPVEEIRAGDTIWTPPGVKHWHGASPASSMTHLAMQEALDGKAVEWLEKVTDADYNAAVAAAPKENHR